MAFFGFEHVEDWVKTHKIKDLFDRVTPSYDLMNDVMSLGVHRLWKNEFIKNLRITPGCVILDMASGTGDIAQGISQEYEALEPRIIAFDLNEAMLNVGKDKAIDKGIVQGITYIQGDAEALLFCDESIDMYVCAFGLRNVGNLENALREAYRVLKPGGHFYSLEFSHVENPFVKQAYDLYSTYAIPTFGGCIAKNRDAYQYLVDSIRTFPNQEEFKQLIQNAGFIEVSYTNMSFGIVAMHHGVK